MAAEAAADLAGTRLFYYEVFELQFRQNTRAWVAFQPESSFPTAVRVPQVRRLEGYDVVTFSCGTAPECSPLSCNGLAAHIAVNAHCLIASFDEAQSHVDRGRFDNSEPAVAHLCRVFGRDSPQVMGLAARALLYGAIPRAMAWDRARIEPGHAR